MSSEDLLRAEVDSDISNESSGFIIGLLDKINAVHTKLFSVKRLTRGQALCANPRRRWEDALVQ